MTLPNERAGEACRLPTPPAADDEAIVRRMLRAKRVAVVGISADPYKASHDVAAYLLAAGYEILPINPNYDEVLGLRCYPSLADVPGPIDLVNVFRRPEHCADVVREAVAAGAKGVWLQSGIVNEEARPDPYNPYAVSKYAMELGAASY